MPESGQTRAPGVSEWQWTLVRLLRRSRIVIYGAVLCVVAYYLWRFDLVQIPPDGNSPLVEFPAGTRLIVDVHAGSIETGDAVLYRTPAGLLLLGRTSVPPADADEAVRAACAAGAFWILKERAGVPGEDSLVLGPIAAGAIAGKIAGTVPW